MHTDKKIRFFNEILHYISATLCHRPFYFLVHPDLFGKYPAEQAANEQAMKALKSYVDSQGREEGGQKQQQRPNPKNLTFYLRPRTQEEKERREGGLRAVRIRLSSPSVRKTVLAILRTVDLPTSKES